MKKQLLQNMLATIVALFIAIIALPTTAQAQDYVDLGLPSGTKWATCNLGASKPSDYGDYYAWGETEPKAEYTLATYKWMQTGQSDWKHITKYTADDGRTPGIWYDASGNFIGDGKTTLEAADDAATAKLGSPWRMPTLDEINELLDNCTWTWTTQDGKKGYEVKGKNGKSIFLPAAGSRYSSELDDAGRLGYYWSSSLNTANSERARYLDFDSRSREWYNHVREYGFPVRPVYADTQAPSAPSITSMTSTTNSITVNWSKSTDNMTPQSELRYRVWCGLAGGNEYAGKDIVTNQTSYTVTGLEPDTEYTLYVMAFDKADNNASSAKKTIRTQAVHVESYSIDIGDVEITADNYTDISASNGFTAVKSGTVSYNPENRTLTLDNAVIEGNSNSITFTDEDMYHAYTLVLKGNGNRLTSASSSTLLTRSNLTITGGGSAQMTSEEDCGIFVNTDATLTITGGCSITAEGKWGITGLNGESETLIIDGATVKAKGNGTEGSICDFKEIQLKNCAITAPSGATVEGGSVVLNGSVCKEQVVIEPKQAEAYDLVIGGVLVTSDNYTDISASNGFPAVKSGTVSYNPATRTLTLDNAVIEMESGNVIRLIDEDKSHAYTLVLKGNGNRLTSVSSSTLSAYSNLTITGGGSAQMTSEENCGIFVETDATLTITGGCSITAEGEWGIAVDDDSSGTLIIDGATVKAQGSEGSICDFKEIVLKNCAITAPSGATVEGGNVMLGGEVCTDWVTIEPVTTETYGIYIGGVEITADNCADISASNGFTAVKSGTVSYNPENRTLTLDNAVIERESGNVIWLIDEDKSHAYTLVLKGNGNRLSASSATLATRSNLTITGGGSAQMTSKEDCGIIVDTDATLTITGGCSITAEGMWGITGQVGSSGTLIIDGATVKAQGSEGSICDFEEIVLKNCAITAPSGATVEGGNVMLGGEVCTDWVTIEPVTTESYGIFIGDVEITADNYTDISASNGFPAVKSGTVSYNPENRTLTLDNAVIEGNSNSITFTDEDMYHAYTLVLKGNGNRLTSASSSTLLTRSNLTITGGGSAQMTSEEDCGIFVNTDATLTITGGCSITAEGKWGITGLNGESETLIIDGATVKAQGSEGSICDFKEIQLKNCAITAPSGATVEGGNVMLGGEVCTDWVTIEPIGTGIDAPNTASSRAPYIYNVQGVRLGTSLDSLPAGVYIIDGKKVVKR